MATIGKVIFRILLSNILLSLLVFSMIGIIIFLLAAIALIIGIGVSGQDSATVITYSTVALVGDSGILGCTFTPDVKQTSDILWEKVGTSGYVYKYEKGEATLSGQNVAFQGRASLFLNQVISGNASLKLTKVQVSDSGVYKCTVSNSNGIGDDTLRLKVGGFSPVVVSVVPPDTLRCDSATWLPKPTVTWLNESRHNLNQTSTNFTPSFNSMQRVTSLLYNIQQEKQYSCIIQNDLATAEGDAIWTVQRLRIIQLCLKKNMYNNCRAANGQSSGSTVPDDELRDYHRVKEVILARYAMTPEAYRRRFRDLKKTGKDSHAE
ncbi:V-set domain-containing T-cell activation inhibitor 1 [Pelodytes ibericus]